MEFPLDAGYRLLTPRKSPHQFPGGGSSISCDHGSNDWPQDRPDKPADFHNLHLDRIRDFDELRNLVEVHVAVYFTRISLYFSMC